MLNGIVKGDIEAGERVELGSKARVLGNVHYTVIETAVGAQINGKLIHRAKAGPVRATRQLPADASRKVGAYFDWPTVAPSTLCTHEHHLRIDAIDAAPAPAPPMCWSSRMPRPARSAN